MEWYQVSVIPIGINLILKSLALKTDIFRLQHFQRGIWQNIFQKAQDMGQRRFIGSDWKKCSIEGASL